MRDIEQFWARVVRDMGVLEQDLSDMPKGKLKDEQERRDRIQEISRMLVMLGSLEVSLSLLLTLFEVQLTDSDRRDSSVELRRQVKGLVADQLNFYKLAQYSLASSIKGLIVLEQKRTDRELES
ncbi:hypothetical protein CCP3SC15_5270001 [Gammaproteobacteria bacterium]